MTTPTTETVIEDLKLEIEDARRNDVLYRLAFSWEVVQALIAELERLRADATETRRAALLDMAKAMCPHCRDGAAFEFISGHKMPFHKCEDGIRNCFSTPIYAMLAKEQEQAGGEGGGDD